VTVRAAPYPLCEGAVTAIRRFAAGGNGEASLRFLIILVLISKYNIDHAIAPA
jgi:hypothetical protein